MTATSAPGRIVVSGSLISMSDLGIEQADIEGNYAPGILDVGVVDDELYGIMVKLNSKSTIFYDPQRFAEMGVRHMMLPMVVRRPGVTVQQSLERMERFATKIMPLV